MDVHNANEWFTPQPMGPALNVSTEPWLSVITPVYNGERYLATALQSVLAQSDGAIELLVSDDGSSDGSARLVDSFSGFRQVRTLRGPRKGNWVSNSNEAVARSRGKFVTFLHQDDLWLPGRLQLLRQVIKDHPDCCLWIGPTRFIGPADNIVGTWRLPFRRKKTHIGSQAFVERLLVQNFLGMPTPVFTREAFDDVGGMDESLWFTADWDLWLKLGALGDVAIAPEASTGFRLHPHSQTMNGGADDMKAQIETVRARHLPVLPIASKRNTVDRAGRFSASLNTCLARAFGGQPALWRQLAPSFAGLGLRGAYRFARDARFLERSMARLRVGLASQSRAY